MIFKNSITVLILFLLIHPGFIQDYSNGRKSGKLQSNTSLTNTKVKDPALINSARNEIAVNAIQKENFAISGADELVGLFVCPSIGAIQFTDVFCPGWEFEITVSGLDNMAEVDNMEANFGINFVYFNGSTPPADPYTGGTSLGIVPFYILGGTDPDQTATIPTSLPSSGVFTICAILDPPSSDPGCAPYTCAKIIIDEGPTASLSGTMAFCPYDCQQIDINISGGTYPYDVYMTLQLGLGSVPVDIQNYDTLNQLIVCYDGSGYVPEYDQVANIFHFPVSETGSVTIILDNVIDDIGCETMSISPNSVFMEFFDGPEINNLDSIVACDDDLDGLAKFNLTQYDVVLSGGVLGSDVQWFEDAGGNSQINFPGGYLTGTTTVYASIYDANCPSDTIPIDLIVALLPNAGISDTIMACNLDGSIIDFDLELGGDPGGIWLDESNSGVDISNPSSVKFFGVPTGSYIYSYTFASLDFCPEVSAHLTVDVVTPPNPGNDNKIEFCEGSTTIVNLIEALGSNYKTGGIWTDPDQSNVDLSDPGQVDFSTTGVDTYEFIYTVESGNICPDQYAVITVKVIEIPRPGDSDSLTICNVGKTRLDIEIALGIFDDVGKWKDVDTSGVQLYPPGDVDFKGIDTGFYNFVYLIEGTNYCPEDSAVITVEVQAPLSAGEDGSISICKNTVDTINLFDLILGESDETGVWTQLSGTTTDLSDPYRVPLYENTTVIDSFSYLLENYCGMDSAFAVIEFGIGISAGEDYERWICSSSDTLSLYDSLFNADASGIWYDKLFNVVENPDTLLIDSMDFLIYYYITPPNAGCPADTAEAIFHLIDNVFAGRDSSIFVCQGSDWTQNLFELIPGFTDSIGSWIQLSGNPVDISNPYAVEFINTGIGIDSFLYILETECKADSALALISVDDALSAGEDYSINICSNITTINLHDSLNGYDLGGNWFDQNMNPVGNPGTLNIFSGESYTYYYIIPENGSCGADTAKAEIKVVPAPQAGLDAALFICRGVPGSFNLFEQLGGNPDSGGEWSDIDGSGLGLANWSSLDFSGMSTGNFRFRYKVLNGDTVCPADSAVLTVSIIESPNPGSDNNLRACRDGFNDSINLDSLLLTHDQNGSWSDVQNAGVDLSDPTAVDFSGVSPGSYTFSYTISETSTCPEAEASITIELISGPDAGENGAFSICEYSANSVNLFDYLDAGTAQNGDWSASGQSIIDLSNYYDVDLSAIQAGEYVFQYILEGEAICKADTSLVMMTVEHLFLTGIGDSIRICNGVGEEALNLFDLLSGYDPGGQFRELTVSGVDISDPGAVDFSGVAEGLYIFEYYFPASVNCPATSTKCYLEVSSPSYTLIEAEICPDEYILIGSSLFDLDNPVGTAYLTNSQGCDSLIEVNLSAKTIDAEIETTDENCLGLGSIDILSMENVILPVFLSNSTLGLFEINQFPHSIQVSSGSYLLLLKDSISCQIEQNAVIGAFPGYALDMVDEAVVFIDESYQINVQTDMDFTSAQWSPESGLACTDCLEPLASPVTDTEYTLVLTNALGCTLTDKILIRVIDNREVFIPNAFSPNNDEINALFNVKSNGATGVYSMKIYSRWGELIYSGDKLQLNDEFSGWDGRFRGSLLNPGVYVYSIEVFYSNGDSGMHSGDVLLLR